MSFGLLGDGNEVVLLVFLPLEVDLEEALSEVEKFLVLPPGRMQTFDLADFLFSFILAFFEEIDNIVLARGRLVASRLKLLLVRSPREVGRLRPPVPFLHFQWFYN